MNLCFDCLSKDVSVKVIDQFGFEHWFCTVCWEGWQEFHRKLSKMMEEAINAFR